MSEFEAVSAPSSPQDRAASLSSKMLVAPDSIAGERYRLLARRVESRRIARLGVACPSREDGPLSVALNLAHALSHRWGDRVLLVEADLRAPRFAEELRLPFSVGLAEALHEGQPIERALLKIPGTALTVLPAGSTATAQSLLDSQRLGQAFAQLTARFDHIIVDAPPASPTADLAAIAPLLDGLLLVARVGKTKRGEVARAIRSIPEARWIGSALLG